MKYVEPSPPNVSHLSSFIEYTTRKLGMEYAACY